ncbi:MAG TPA: primosomal protein N' [Firmicutes bacterium]|nr:primosomal protein N' [Bacillota bacterium]
MKAIAKYAGVIVDVKASAVNRVFHYWIPEHLDNLQLGHRVLVPFGSRRVEAYVVELVDDVEIEPERIKAIIKTLDPEPVLTIEHLEVAAWMVKEYAGLYAQALQFFLPTGTRYGKERVGDKRQLVVKLIEPERIEDYLQSLPRRAVKQEQVLLSLKRQPHQLASELCRNTNTSYQTLTALQAKGYIIVEPALIERRLELSVENKPVPVLTEQQSEALKAIIAEFHTGRNPVLIHGVTDSGKTEVYLQAIAYCLEFGKQAIMMVPEISLTEQTIARFTQRFPNQVAVLHSGLSEGERYDQWQKIHKGDLPIVIGARSAVFAPLQNIGLIVIDEEHEGTYKQTDGMLKYHTRSVALQRAQYHDAVVVMGSATPAVESYHRALRGEYRLVEMPNRIYNRPFPQVSLVDMRKEFADGNRSMFSDLLTEELAQTLERHEQAIILLNRRGYSAFVLCRACGYVASCSNCHVSLTYHRDNRLKCHYCGYSQELRPSCPQCGSHYIRQFGTGTQQLEEHIRKYFTKARIVRLDADTTKRKGSHQRLLNQFRQGQANVLIGTQMIAKGLDFPNVTLVGVISADFALNFPDFRAGERTYQLLAQVSGRAGRGPKPGKVIIQCYDPDHYAVCCVPKHDYGAFYRQEITYRRQLDYPPLGYLTRILIQGPEAVVQHQADEILYLLQGQLANVRIYGPAPAPISRLKGRHRWQIIIKSKHKISHLLTELPKHDGTVTISVDPDPLFLL